MLAGLYRFSARGASGQRQGFLREDLVEWAKRRFDAEITIAKDGRTVNGKSMMGVMTLAAEQGSSIEVTTCGPQAAEAMQAIRELVEAGFHLNENDG